MGPVSFLVYSFFSGVGVVILGLVRQKSWQVFGIFTPHTKYISMGRFADVYDLSVTKAWGTQDT